MLSRLSLTDSTIIGVTLSKAFIVLSVWNLSPVLQYQFFEYVKVNNHVVYINYVRSSSGTTACELLVPLDS